METLINLLPIVLGGGRAYAAVGTEQSTGPKLFCLSGAVAGPGVYEVAFGATLRELLALAGGTTGGEPRAILLGGAAGSFVGPEHLDLPLTFEDTRAAGATLGSGVVMPFAPGTDFVDVARRIAQFFRDESCGQCVPCRVGTVRQEEALQRLAAGGRGERTAARRPGAGNGRRVDLRPGPHGGVGAAIGPAPRAARSQRRRTMNETQRSVTLTVDGRTVQVAEGATILDACRQLQIDTPTMCFADNLTPVNACRVCVVELEGSRTLVPACARAAAEGMQVRTDSERVRHSRRLVLELLASSVDLSCAGEALQRWQAELRRRAGAVRPAGTGRRTRRAGAPARRPPRGPGRRPPRPPSASRPRCRTTCTYATTSAASCATSAWRRAARTPRTRSPSRWPGRGFDARIATEYEQPLPDSACVYCGNCIGVCPTGALMFKSEFDHRAAGTWDESRQDVTRTVCSYCGVGCNLELHVQDEEIVKVTSPADHSVTNGHLCVKGRFGFQFVQNRPDNP